MLYVPVSFLTVFKQENSSSPAALKGLLKPVTERSCWQLVDRIYHGNQQPRPGGALPAVAQSGGLALGCVVGGRSEALYLAALARERCWIAAPAIPVQLFLGKFSSKARAQPRACFAPWAGYSLFALRPENWMFPSFPRACLPL